MLIFSTRRSAVVAAAVLSAALVVVLLLLVLELGTGGASPYLRSQPVWPRSVEGGGGIVAARSLPIVVSNRKLLQDDVVHGGGGGGVAAASEEEEEPNRIGEACSKEDLVVYQGPTSPLPNGIPTYTVQILNVCVSGCAVSHIHLSCGWFSSARLINPRIFRRLRYDDCLVNDGRALPSGGSISFQYANSFHYPLAVSSLSCVPSST